MFEVLGQLRGEPDFVGHWGSRHSRKESRLCDASGLNAYPEQVDWLFASPVPAAGERRYAGSLSGVCNRACRFRSLPVMKNIRDCRQPEDEQCAEG